MAEGVPADRDVLLLFAATHDTQRHNEFHDPEHGARAADLIKRLHRGGALALADGQLELLHAALIGHDQGETTDDATIGACWDADRLTLWRVGIMPDRKYLSTKPARQFDLDFVGFGCDIVEGADLDWEKVVEAYGSGVPTDRIAFSRGA